VAPGPRPDRTLYLLKPESLTRTTCPRPDRTLDWTTGPRPDRRLELLKPEAQSQQPHPMPNPTGSTTSSWSQGPLRPPLALRNGPTMASPWKATHSVPMVAPGVTSHHRPDLSHHTQTSAHSATRSANPEINRKFKIIGNTRETSRSPETSAFGSHSCRPATHE
jgi:hypothetical protein